MHVQGKTKFDGVFFSLPRLQLEEATLHKKGPSSHMSTKGK